MMNGNNGYYEVQVRLLEQAKKDFDNQLDRFSTIWCKEVVNRKRQTKRGVIAVEVLMDISDDIYSSRSGYGQWWSYRDRFESAYKDGNVWSAQRVVSDLKNRLDGYKKKVRQGVIDWYGC